MSKEDVQSIPIQVLRDWCVTNGLKTVNEFYSMSQFLSEVLYGDRQCQNCGDWAWRDFETHTPDGRCTYAAGVLSFPHIKAVNEIYGYSLTGAHLSALRIERRQFPYNDKPIDIYERCDLLHSPLWTPGPVRAWLASLPPTTLDLIAARTSWHNYPHGVTVLTPVALSGNVTATSLQYSFMKARLTTPWNPRDEEMAPPF